MERFAVLLSMGPVLWWLAKLWGWANTLELKVMVIWMAILMAFVWAMALGLSEWLDDRRYKRRERRP